MHREDREFRAEGPDPRRDELGRGELSIESRGAR
jgi:hypothetical protein